MNRRSSTARGLALVSLVSLVLCVAAAPAAGGRIDEATLEERGQRTSEICTDEMRRLLREGSATVLDVRPRPEYALAHISGAKNVAAKPGLEKALYVPDVAEVGVLVNGDKKAPLVLYGNGPFCGTTKRLAEELLREGHTNVSRYQLGIAVWRALGGVCAVDFDGFRYAMERDRTAIVIDVRAEKDSQASAASER